MQTEKRATRDGWGEALLELGEKDERIVVLTADVADSTRVSQFAKRFPKRFVQCGVAEQNMMGIAAGLAAAGKRPFVSAYAVFSPGRSWDQLRVAVCYSNLPVVVGGSHSGFSAGGDGATHQALEDIAITRCLPNMTVIAPCDYRETKKAVKAAINLAGPAYIRFAREETAVLTSEETPFEIGKAEVLRIPSGNSGQLQVALIGAGPILSECLKAAEDLEKEGISAEVINCHTIKPVDKATLMKAARDCGAVVTVEEHQVMGGLGSVVAETLAENYPVPMEFVGMRGSFGESGKPDELAEKYGLKAINIAESAKKVIARKKNQDQ